MLLLAPRSVSFPPPQLLLLGPRSVSFPLPQLLLTLSPQLLLLDRRRLDLALSPSLLGRRPSVAVKLALVSFSAGISPYPHFAEHDLRLPFPLFVNLAKLNLVAEHDFSDSEFGCSIMTTKMIHRQKYYVVFEGRSRGIYNSWEQCQPLVYRYKGALFRSFHTYEAAEYQMNEYLHNKYGVQFCRPLDIVDVKATEEKEVMKTNGRTNNQVFWIAFFFYYLFCLLDLYSLNFYVLDGTHVIW
ncbi:hypothetical protein EJ110_NYTH12385 [Nymphaea thermarum]|nr:hypothetical protein EJ110_NYTH12385 [Nymphaea thermarum]